MRHWISLATPPHTLLCRLASMRPSTDAVHMPHHQLNAPYCIMQCYAESMTCVARTSLESTTGGWTDTHA